MAVLFVEDYENPQAPQCRGNPNPQGLPQINYEPIGSSTNGNNNCPGGDEAGAYSIVGAPQGAPVFEGATCMKIHLDWRVMGDPSRSEIVQGPLGGFNKLNLEEEVWCSFSHYLLGSEWYLDPYVGTGGQSNWTSFWNIHARPPYSSNISLRTLDDKYDLRIGYCTQPTQNPCLNFTRILWGELGTVVVDQWVHWIVHFKHSVTNGFCHVYWRPDSQVTWNGPFSYTGPLGHNPAPGQTGNHTGFMKYGIYHSSYANTQVQAHADAVGDHFRTVYYDNMRGWDDNTTFDDVADTFGDPEPPTPPPGGTVGQAFKVIRGQAVIAASSTTATITESTDYTLEAGVTINDAFIRITNTSHTGMGNNSGASGQFDDDYSVYISNPGNLLTSITFTRQGSPATTCHVSYEIIQYIGSASGDNEMIVRAQGTVSGTAAQLTGPTITTITDQGDCVVFITGQASSDTSRFDSHYRLWEAQLVANASNWDPQFDRLSTATADTAYISYAVVEFVGSNWTVDRVTTDTEGTTWSASDNNSFTVAHGVTIASAAKAGIIEMQYTTDNDATSGREGWDSFKLDDATNIRYWNQDQVGVRRKVAWILQNSQSSGLARNMNVQHLQYRDDTGTGGVREWTQNFSSDPDHGTGATTVAPIEECSVVCGASVNTASQPHRACIDYWLTGTNQITFRESDATDERRITLELFEWPEDEDAVIRRAIVCD